MTIENILVETFPADEKGNSIGNSFVTRAYLEEGVFVTDLGILLHTTSSERGQKNGYTFVEGRPKLGLSLLDGDNLNSISLDSDGNLILAEVKPGQFSLKFITRVNRRLGHRITGVSK